MDQNRVIQDLKRRFSEDLPKYYKRRIIFWKDEEREFEDLAPTVSIDGVKVVVLTSTNNFAVKRLLTEEDQESNYLVYCPMSYPEEEDWLLPIELYSEEFRADQLSMWLDEMGIEATASMRKAARGYRDFLKTKGHRTKVAGMARRIKTPSHFQLAVMAVLCGLSEPQPDQIIRTVLSAGLDERENQIYDSLVRYGAKDAFWAMVNQGTGYQMIAGEDGQENNLERFACHLLLTASTRTLRSESLAGLEDYLSFPHQAYCYDVVSNWMRRDDRRSLYAVAREVERELRLLQRFQKLTVQDLRDTEIFPCIDECILMELMTEISNQIINVDVITSVAEERRTCVWYEDYRDYYDGVAACARMQSFYLAHADGFHTVEPQNLWKEYTKDYYRMDTYYREFQNCFSRSLVKSIDLLDDLFKQVADVAEGLYSSWFLGELGSSWSKACAEDLEKYGRIQYIPQQEDFYRKWIAAADRPRVFVIISDAFRYETAVSLADQLRRESKAQVKLKSCEAIFPTVTKFGMAALLPHKELSVEEKTGGLAVLADGSSTEAPYREEVLKKANPSSIAVKYSDIVKMKRDERSALVKGKEVIYIYHNRIDEMSHTDQNAVFSSCEDAISEIKNMIRIIVNDFGGTNVLVTADHGFLYTYKPLQEDSKVDKGIRKEDVVELDRRYLIARKGAQPEYLLPVRFMDGRTEYEAFAPRESIRIKKKGGGENFVHGGISLQEMVVPVVEYHYLRNQSKEYKKNRSKYDTKPVSVSLLSASRKVSNMIFSLNFYQEEPVSGNREAAAYQLYFVDSENSRVSDTARIIADKTSENNQDRTFRVNFNLKSQKFDSREPYYLVIADESGLQIPERIEFTIDIAFAVDDFDFFG